MMFSFDVTVLFTSIDMTLAKETLATSVHNPKTQTCNETFSENNMLKLLHLCLTTHFVFNGQVYEQINGKPMGSPISGLITEAVMQRLEHTALPQIQPKLWF
eukprot:g25531.t1